MQTREQKRLQQKRRAYIVGVAFIIGIFLVGFLSGVACSALTKRDKAVRPVTGQTQAETSEESSALQADEVMSTLDAPSPFYPLTDDERDIVERVVAAEANTEGFTGQVLVAQCVLNTSLARDMRPDEVVLEAGQYASPTSEASEEVKEAVSAVFDDGYKVTEEPIRFFYAPKHSAGTWHESSLEFVLEWKGHKFFKVKGD